MSEKRENCKECGGSGCVDGRDGALIKCRCCAGTGVHAPDCAFPRVEACIQGAMRQFPGATGRYYEEVHQRLAPLARDLERELIAAAARIRELESQNREWLAANAPGGWIDDMRRELERASQPGGGEADTARLDLLIEYGALVDTITNADGEKRYQLAWPNLDETQNAWYRSARAAIDAMISAAPSAGNGGAEGDAENSAVISADSAVNSRTGVLVQIIQNQ